LKKYGYTNLAVCGAQYVLIPKLMLSDYVHVQSFTAPIPHSGDHLVLVKSVTYM